MKAFSKGVLIAFFAAVLFFPHLLAAVLPEKWSITADEKRTMASFPVFSFENIKQWPTEFENWYSDHLPFRHSLIRLNNNLEYYGFRNSTDKTVVIGKNGWLFYNDATDGDPIAMYEGRKQYDGNMLKQIADELQTFSDALKAQGREFVLFIAPNKERVYSEYMPDYLGKPAENYATDVLVAYLKEHTDVRVVYVYDALMQAKKDYPQWDYYIAMDTHWNNIGAYVGCRELLMELGFETVRTLDKVVIEDRGPASGDLRNKLNISIDKTKSARKYLVYGHGRDKSETIVNNPDAEAVFHKTGANHRKLLIIRDSFGEAMMPVMSAFFNDCIFVHRKAYKQEMISEYNPRIVVWEMIERSCDKWLVDIERALQ